MLLKLVSKRGLTVLGVVLLTASLVLAVYVRVLFNPPSDFISVKSFEITSGMSVKDISREAQAQGIVRSSLLLYTILTKAHDPTNIYAGTYVFEAPVNVFGVAQKLANKDIENELISVTIPEGVRLTKIAAIATTKLPAFDADDYLIRTNGLEGKLFPETYFVPETFTAQKLIDLQQQTYEENVAPLREQIETSSFTEWEVLTLASIIEREANDEESMRMVSGILQNRLAIDMALQADATMEYALNSPLGELPEGQLALELRETDSPYNTYLNRGLPPTPIGNPGIMAINAVLDPTPSDNFYYITGNDGEFYYARTLEEHNTNIALHLR